MKLNVYERQLLQRLLGAENNRLQLMIQDMMAETNPQEQPTNEAVNALQKRSDHCMELSRKITREA